MATSLLSTEVQSDIEKLHDINKKLEEQIQSLETKVIQLTEVQRDIEELHDINKKQEEQIQSLETKVIQLTNLYFVFQGVILSSISSASPAKCHKWWIPFCLSLIASLLNLVSVYGTITYFLRCSEELDQNYEDIQVMRNSRMTRAQVNAVEPGSSEGITRPRADTFEQGKRKFFCYAAMGLLLGFSGIILYACHALLCDTPNDKCVKLC